MNPSADFAPTQLVVIPRPMPASEELPLPAGARVGEADEMKRDELLARLVGAESALYAITREWRWDALKRKFERLHRLLDEQMAEIGSRLIQLAARQRDYEAGDVAADDEGVVVARGSGDSWTETQMIIELLRRHEAQLIDLRAGAVLVRDCFRENETADVLAHLGAGHARDAFMLRALRWEVENHPT